MGLTRHSPPFPWVFEDRAARLVEELKILGHIARTSKDPTLLPYLEELKLNIDTITADLGRINLEAGH